MTVSSARNAWLFSTVPGAEARLRLFCFPHAGGGASMFQTWKRLFPADIEVCPVQLPGRENRLREPAMKSFGELAEALATALLPYLDKPFAFFGHSMGSMVSFELTRYLRRQQLPLPQHLFVSAYRAPQLGFTKPWLHTMSEHDLVQTLLALEGTSREVLEDAELRQFLLPLIRSDFTACETYVYQPEEPLACPLDVFGGLRDQRAPRDVLAAWQEQTSSRFGLHMLPGGHFYLQEQPAPFIECIASQL
jgi:medium-chain acyl-[acyl-carrier-protein] hydrolase